MERADNMPDAGLFNENDSSEGEDVGDIEYLIGKIKSGGSDVLSQNSKRSGITIQNLKSVAKHLGIPSSRDKKTLVNESSDDHKESRACRGHYRQQCVI